MVRVERHKRRLLHEVWPRLVAGPVGSVASYLDYATRVWGDGLTPGEKRYLELVQADLQKSHEELMTIYFRLKK